MTSPLPDIDGMLHQVAKARFKSSLDLKNTYQQIWIIPEHVEQSAVTTPDGNMVSFIVQMGDCNAPETYQALMNHIFSPYISCFLDVYLDDILILLKITSSMLKLLLIFYIVSNFTLVLRSCIFLLMSFNFLEGLLEKMVFAWILLRWIQLLHGKP